MATNQPQAAVTPQALESLQKLRINLHESAAAAMANKDAYMHGVYTELLAIVSKRVVKTQARMAREQVASHRKQHKDLRRNALPNDATSA